MGNLPHNVHAVSVQLVLAKCRGMVPQTVVEHVGLVYGDTFMEGS